MMDSPDKKSSDPGLIKTVSSLQFGLVVLITITCIAILGTIIPQGRSSGFYEEQYSNIVNYFIGIFRLDNTYRSPLFLGLLGLLGLNLILCSLVKLPVTLKKTFKPELTPDSESILSMPIAISHTEHSLESMEKAFQEAGFPLRRVTNDRLYGEKGRFGYLGASTVHLSLLILLCGGMISLITGFRGYIELRNGEIARDAMISEEYSIPLGFEIELNRFEVRYYEDFPGRPKSYTSSVTVKLPDGTQFTKDIRVNSPLMLNNYTIYQSSYGVLDNRLSESAVDDTARVSILLKGAPETMPPIVTLEMVMGNIYNVPGFGDSIAVRLAEMHRNFRGSSVQPGELNPAARIDVLVNGELKWSVYSFKNFPGLNMPMYQDLDFTFSLVDFKTGSSVHGDGDSERYYTVLGVVRDRGIPVVWTGAMLLMLGLLLSFYVRPRRLWLLEENGILFVGGMVKGDPESFRKFVKKVIEHKKANDI